MGRFEAWDVLWLGTLGVGTFCSWDVLVLGTFCSWDDLGLGRFIGGTLSSGTFCSWDVFWPGIFCLGTLCRSTDDIVTSLWDRNTWNRFPGSEY